MASSSYPDIWEISDDEYDEPPSSFPSTSQLTVDRNEVIDIGDTDSDDAPPPSSQIPSSSQPCPFSTVDLTLTDDYSDDQLPTFCATVLDDDSDLPPLELLSQSPRKRRLSQSASNDADASPTKKTKSQSSSPAKTPLASASSSPAKEHARQKRKRRTSRERRDEEQEKDARRAQNATERQLKKAAELAAKERKKQEKIEAAAITAQQKAEAAAMKDANKLQHNKRDVVMNMTLILSDSFQHAHADLLPSLKKRFCELRGTILFGRQLLRNHHTIQWKMRSNKRYSAETRNWIPCEEHEVLQSTALLYITGANLVHLVSTRTLVQTVKDFRDVSGSKSSHLQTFIMVEHLERERQRNDVHQALASLNITCHTHHIFVEGVEEAVERLYNITADIGIKPYKLIERSHLPFCADFKQIESGKTLKETWNRMLCQIPGVTFSGAQGILEHYPTVSSLFRKYAENPAAGGVLLQNCMVRERRDGVQNARRLNKAVSTRVHAVLCGQDELEVVARGA